MARVRYSQPKRARKIKEFHAHGCLACGRRYTDTCGTPAVNAECTTCRTGQPPATWDRDYEPQSCCRRHAVLITTVDVLDRYSLAGPGPWFLCRECARTHPFDPKE